MAKKKNKFKEKIKKEFEYYCSIKESEKRLTARTIRVFNRGNHRGCESGCVDLEAEKFNLTLEVERNCNSAKDFKFKIFNHTFMDEPCYRFDSDGDGHLNKGDVYLPEKFVETPHFHKYDKNGDLIAYKTDDWITDKDKLLSDQCAALASFANEENIVYDELPNICNEGELFPPENKMHDPLEGEDFNE